MGCPKVTHEGLWGVLNKTQTPLLGLGLEGLSPTFVRSSPPHLRTVFDHPTQDLAWLADQCQKAGTLKSLTNMRIAVDHKMLLSGWTTQLNNLLKDSSLTEFELSSTGGEMGLTLSTAFCDRFIREHADRIRRFCVHRLNMGPELVKTICERCPKLEELFVTMASDDLVGTHPAYVWPFVADIPNILT